MCYPLMVLFSRVTCSVLSCTGDGGYQPPKRFCKGNKRAMPPVYRQLRRPRIAREVTSRLQWARAQRPPRRAAHMPGRCASIRGRPASTAWSSWMGSLCCPAPGKSTILSRRPAAARPAAHPQVARRRRPQPGRGNGMWKYRGHSWYIEHAYGSVSSQR